MRPSDAQQDCRPCAECVRVIVLFTLVLAVPELLFIELFNVDIYLLTQLIVFPQTGTVCSYSWFI